MKRKIAGSVVMMAVLLAMILCWSLRREMLITLNVLLDQPTSKYQLIIARLDDMSGVISTQAKLDGDGTVSIVLRPSDTNQIGEVEMRAFYVRDDGQPHSWGVFFNRNEYGFTMRGETRLPPGKTHLIFFVGRPWAIPGDPNAWPKHGAYCTRLEGDIDIPAVP